jgi:hypothetical protein
MLLDCLEFSQNCGRYDVELLMSGSFIFFWPVLCVASFYSKSFFEVQEAMNLLVFFIISKED